MDSVMISGQRGCDTSFVQRCPFGSDSERRSNGSFQEARELVDRLLPLGKKSETEGRTVQESGRDGFGGCSGKEGEE